MTEALTHLLGWIRPFTLMRWSVYTAIAAVLWVVLNYTTLQEYFQARDRKRQYEEQVARLQKQQTLLQVEHGALKAGGFPAEKAIRERLLMIRPGEKIIFVETPETTQPAVIQAPSGQGTANPPSE